LYKPIPGHASSSCRAGLRGGGGAGKHRLRSRLPADGTALRLDDAYGERR
jgi:hypothetical protein